MVADVQSTVFYMKVGLLYTDSIFRCYVILLAGPSAGGAIGSAGSTFGWILMPFTLLSLGGLGAEAGRAALSARGNCHRIGRVVADELAACCTFGLSLIHI